MSQRAHRPERTCLGCGSRDEQKKLFRLVLDKQGELKIQRVHGGRGGYLHVAPDCWQQFLKRKSHQRTFRAEIRKAAKEKLVKELIEGYWEFN
jgi:predicted RNA-binding protein YlxR (DUF448 family)